MLHIFLVILKIIGIILAILFGILLFVVLSVLFWPVRYRGKGQYFEQFQGSARISFWGPVLWFTLRYEEELVYKLRIFGIPVISSDKPMKQSENHGNKHKTSILDEEELLDDEEKDTDMEFKSSDTLLATPENKDLKDANSEVSESESDEGDSEESSAGFFDKIRNIPKKITEMKKRIIEKVKSIWQTVKNVFRFLGNLKETWDDEGVRIGLGKLKDEVWLLLKKIRPRKLKWYTKFGFENPATTGQVLGALCVIQGLWGKPMDIEPDFENKILETEFELKGFIQGFRLVRLGWRCYFDKDIKYFMDKVSKLRRN